MPNDAVNYDANGFPYLDPANYVAAIPTWSQALKTFFGQITAPPADLVARFTDTGWLTGAAVFTPAAGITLVSCVGRRIGKTCEVVIQVSSNAAIVGTAGTGDIAAVVLGQLAATFVPGNAAGLGMRRGLASNGLGPVIAGCVQPTGPVELTAMIPGATIAAGATFGLSGCFNIA